MRVALNVATVGARRGGAEKYVAAVARSLHAVGHEVHLLAAEVDDGELPDDVQIHYLRSRSWPGLHWLQPLRFATASAREVARNEFDLVVGFCPLWNVDVHVALNGCRPALLEASRRRHRTAAAGAVWWIGKHLSPRQWVYRSIESRQFHPENVPLVIAPSHRVAEQFHRCHQLASNQISVVHLGIELDRSDADVESIRQAFRRKRGLLPGDVAVLFAAHNYSLKGLEPLLESFATIAGGCPGAHLLVCGGDREKRYQRLARRLGVGDRVQFLGFVDDLRECFAGVDVFALPTFYDACSLVVLESLAAGVPVVTTRSNGASELVSDGVDGYVLDSPWDLGELSYRLRRLINDSSLREKMARHARVHSERLSIHKSVQRMLDVLQRHMSAGAIQPIAIQQRDKSPMRRAA